MEKIDTSNHQLIGVHGDDVVVMKPKTRMTKAEALVHAAYLVSIVGDDEEWQKTPRSGAGVMIRRLLEYFWPDRSWRIETQKGNGPVEEICSGVSEEMAAWYMEQLRWMRRVNAQSGVPQPASWIRVYRRGHVWSEQGWGATDGRTNEDN